MARELRSFNVTVPAGTAQAAPVSFDVSSPARIVRRIDVTVPPGPRGEVGFYLANSFQQVIPFNAGQWVVANDEKMTWDLTDYVDSGSWQVIAYNTGFYPHTLQVRFHVDLPDAFTQPVTVAPIPLAQLSQPATG